MAAPAWIVVGFVLGFLSVALPLLVLGLLVYATATVAAARNPVWWSLMWTALFVITFLVADALSVSIIGRAIDSDYWTVGAAAASVVGFAAMAAGFSGPGYTSLLAVLSLVTASADVSGMKNGDDVWRAAVALSCGGVALAVLMYALGRVRSRPRDRIQRVPAQR